MASGETFEQIESDSRMKMRSMYEEKRSYIENTFMTQPAHVEGRTVGEDRFRVISNICDLTKFSPYQNGPLRVSVYVPGIFEAEPVNTGNRMEHRLAAGVLPVKSDEGPHLLVYLKTEGLDKQSYMFGNSVGAVHAKTSAVSADKLQEIIDAFKQDHNINPETEVEFTSLAGYSEGSTQSLSLAARIIERNMGSIKQVISVGGAGFVGYRDQMKAHPVVYGARALVETWFGRGDGKTVNKEGSDLYIGKNVIGGVPGHQDGLEHAVAPPVDKRKIYWGRGVEQLNLADDVKNIVEFGNRLVRTISGHAEKDREVPYSRLQAACTLNPDAEFLARHHVPVTIFSGTKDQFFPNRLIRKYVSTLREKYHADMKVITSNMDHAGPHYNASALGFIFELLGSQKPAKP